MPMTNTEAIEIWKEVRVDYDHLMFLLKDHPQDGLKEPHPVSNNEKEEWKN